jgi:hypothetical protein
MAVITEENFSQTIYDIVKKSKSLSDAVEKITKLKYPNSNEYIKDEHAKCFYEKFAKMNANIKIDKDFTKNAYDMNSKIFKEVHVKK